MMQGYLLIISISPLTGRRKIKMRGKVNPPPNSPFVGGPVPQPVPGKDNKDRELVSTGTQQQDQRHAISTIHQNVTAKIVEGHTTVNNVQALCPTMSAASLEGAHIHMHGIARKVRYWKEQLSEHPDKHFAHKICQYVENGVPIEYTGEHLDNEMKNWPSCKIV